MIRFIVKRLLLTIPIVFFLSFLTLVLITIVPGNFFDQLRLNPQISEELITAYETKFHITENVCVQYFYWLKGIAQFDFGYSFTYHMPVIDLLATRLWNTFILSFSAFLCSWCIAIPLGLIAAYRKHSLLDRLLLGCSYFFLSIPGFFLALVVMFLCGNFTTMTLGGMRSVYFEQLSFVGKAADSLIHMSVPLFVIGSASASYLFRLMRSNVLDVLQLDFVRVLRTRGISERSIIFKHVLRNAVNPLITILGFQLPALFSGAALVEIITGWPGLGTIMLQAVRSQDIYLVMGNMFMISLLLVIGNMGADILLGYADPRIRY